MYLKGEDNDIIKIFAFHTTLNKILERKLLSVQERTIIVNEEV